MTTERLAEIERWADSPLLAELKVSKAEEGWIQGGKNTAKVLIAHIRDLEAQVRELSDFKEQFIDKEVKWLTAQANWIAERNKLEAHLAAAREALIGILSALQTQHGKHWQIPAGGHKAFGAACDRAAELLAPPPEVLADTEFMAGIGRSLEALRDGATGKTIAEINAEIAAKTALTAPVITWEPTFGTATPPSPEVGA